MNFLYILLAILFFGLLIFIHELGHFIVARLCGVKILEFAIGMGPRIISVQSKKSGTAYSLRLFPIGGFVSMLGENGMEAVQGDNGQSAAKERADIGENSLGDGRDSFFVNSTDKQNATGEREAQPPKSATDPALAKHAYCNQSVWKRILISVAGPLMNLVLGFTLMVVLVLAAGESYVGGTEIAGFFVEYSAQEEHGGIVQNDQIVAVDGVNIRSMTQLRELVAAKDGGLFAVTVKRLDETQGKSVTVELSDVMLSVEVLKDSFLGSLSEQSGLQLHDKVIKVNGTSVHTANELSYEIMNQGYRPLRLTVMRNGEKVVLDNVMVPSYVESGVTFGNVDFQIFREEAFDAPTVLKHAFWRSCSTVKMVFDSLGGLFSGRYGFEAVSGPIGITEVITDAAKSSALDVLNLLILISINLGIMNLLPFPALDGGHILIYLIEAIRRKPLKPEVEGIINFVGLILLLGLAVLISIKDVISL